jgi:23S rRNA (guanine745-N1)-methyltransferase
VAAVTLLCPVRGCGAPLARLERSLACPRGHAFDLARSGYANLLQPQDRRSRAPGDSREAALARRRLFQAGRLDPLLAALRGARAELTLPAEPAILDLGCGEGSILAALSGSGEAHGLDISTPAIDLAARAFPAITWIVANADRPLPYGAGSFDLALSITSRQRPRELRRVLAPRGALLVAVPGPDDLVELRETLAGERAERRPLSGGETAAASFAPDFTLAGRRALRWTARLDAAGIADVLASSYRGARRAQRARLAGLDELAVTMSREILVLRPASPHDRRQRHDRR